MPRPMRALMRSRVAIHQRLAARPRWRGEQVVLDLAGAGEFHQHHPGLLVAEAGDVDRSEPGQGGLHQIAGIVGGAG